MLGRGISTPHTQDFLHGIHGYRVTWIRGYRDTGIHGYMAITVTGIQGYMVTGLQGMEYGDRFENVNAGMQKLLTSTIKDLLL